MSYNSQADITRTRIHYVQREWLGGVAFEVVPVMRRLVCLKTLMYEVVVTLLRLSGVLGPIFNVVLRASNFVDEVRGQLSCLPKHDGWAQRTQCLPCAT